MAWPRRVDGYGPLRKRREGKGVEKERGRESGRRIHSSYLSCPECTENPARHCCRNCCVNDWESELNWSGRMDLNHRPPGPEPGALARLRYAPTEALSVEKALQTQATD